MHSIQRTSYMHATDSKARSSSGAFSVRLYVGSQHRITGWNSAQVGQQRRPQRRVQVREENLVVRAQNLQSRPVVAAQRWIDQRRARLTAMEPQWAQPRSMSDAQRSHRAIRSPGCRSRNADRRASGRRGRSRGRSAARACSRGTRTSRTFPMGTVSYAAGCGESRCSDAQCRQCGEDENDGAVRVRVRTHPSQSPAASPRGTTFPAERANVHCTVQPRHPCHAMPCRAVPFRTERTKRSATVGYACRRRKACGRGRGRGSARLGVPGRSRRRDAKR